MELFYVLLVLLVLTRAFGELAEQLNQPSLVDELGGVLVPLARVFRKRDSEPPANCRASGS